MVVYIFLEGEVDKYVYEECGATVIEALSILSSPLVAWSWPFSAGPQVGRFGGMRQHQADWKWWSGYLEGVNMFQPLKTELQYELMHFSWLFDRLSILPIPGKHLDWRATSFEISPFGIHLAIALSSENTSPLCYRSVSQTTMRT